MLVTQVAKLHHLMLGSDCQKNQKSAFSQPSHTFFGTRNCLFGSDLRKGRRFRDDNKSAIVPRDLGRLLIQRSQRKDFANNGTGNRHGGDEKRAEIWFYCSLCKQNPFFASSFQTLMYIKWNSSPPAFNCSSRSSNLD